MSEEKVLRSRGFSRDVSEKVDDEGIFNRRGNIRWEQAPRSIRRESGFPLGILEDGREEGNSRWRVGVDCPGREERAGEFFPAENGEGIGREEGSRPSFDGE